MSWSSGCGLGHWLGIAPTVVNAVAEVTRLGDAGGTLVLWADSYTGRESLTASAGAAVGVITWLRASEESERLFRVHVGRDVNRGAVLLTQSNADKAGNHHE